MPCTALGRAADGQQNQHQLQRYLSSSSLQSCCCSLPYAHHEHSKKGAAKQGDGDQLFCSFASSCQKPQFMLLFSWEIVMSDGTRVPQQSRMMATEAMPCSSDWELADRSTLCGDPVGWDSYKKNSTDCHGFLFTNMLDVPEVKGKWICSRQEAWKAGSDSEQCGISVSIPLATAQSHLTDQHLTLSEHSECKCILYEEASDIGVHRQFPLHMIVHWKKSWYHPSSSKILEKLLKIKQQTGIPSVWESFNTKTPDRESWFLLVFYYSLGDTAIGMRQTFMDLYPHCWSLPPSVCLFAASASFPKQWSSGKLNLQK